MKTLKTKKVTLKYNNKEVVVSEEQFNEKGKPSLIKRYDNQGGLLESIALTYTDKDLPQKEEWSDKSGVFQTIQYAYDENGVMTKATLDLAFGGKLFKEFTISEGKEEVVVKDENGNVEGKEVTTYNEQKLPIEFLMYDQDNELRDKVELSYNADNLLLTETTHNLAEKSVSTFSNTYDSEKRILSQKFKDDSIEEEWTYEYEKPSDEVLVGAKYLNAKGTKQLLEKITTTYNTDQEPVEITTHSPHGFPNFDPNVKEMTQVIDYTFW